MQRKVVWMVGIAVGFSLVAAFSYYLFFHYFPQKRSEVKQGGLPSVYQKYQETEVGVVTNRYTVDGFERDSFKLVAPEEGVVVVYNDDRVQEMLLEVSEGPNESYPQELASVNPGENIEIPLPQMGRYVIRDLAAPEEVFFEVTLYPTLEEAKSDI